MKRSIAHPRSLPRRLILSALALLSCRAAWCAAGNEEENPFLRRALPSLGALDFASAAPGNFGMSADGSARRAPTALEPPAAAGRPLAGGAGATRTARIDASQLGQIIQFEVPDEDRDRGLPALQRALERLQETEEGRRLLAGLQREYRATGGHATVALTRFPDSHVSLQNGVEVIDGAVYGQSFYDKDRVELNRDMLDFKDADIALEVTLTTLGHELHHLLRHRYVQRVLPRYGDAYEYDLGDEMSSRLSEWLVLLQLEPRRATADTEILRQFADDPRGYVDGLKLADSDYATSLEVSEMADPVAALNRRVRSLEARLRGRQGRLDEELPGKIRALRHMMDVHDMRVALQDLWREAQDDLSTLPANIRDTRETIAAVRKEIDELQSPDGRRTVRLLRSAAKDPRYLRLRDENEGRKREILRWLREHPLPKPSRPEGQLDWDVFWSMVDRDKKEHPEHWRP